tara:strand:- start:403 stop:2184 length:1782 start_codon:yes stop_codon:yes gene_type:complete
MTVSSATTRNSYSGNGSTDVFAYGFKIFDDDDITVIIRTDSTGAETTKTKTTHYTVSGVGSSSGGNVTFTSGNIPASGETVVLLRTTARTQLTDYVPNDPFPAATHEDALDKLTFIAQELEEELGRTLKVSQTNVIATAEFTEDATARANKLLGFDGSGNLQVSEGKVDTVTASVSAVSAGGSPTASATYTASTGALALAFGLVTGNTGATGNSAGLQMTFNNSTSDADPGAGKLALNNGTLASVTEIYFDDADDNSADISTFIQSFDDVANATGRGIVHIEKEGTPATFALYKVTGSVTDASGYTKVPVSHLVSNGTFSNSDGIRVDFSYSGNDGSGGITNVSGDTSPQLGGDLDMVTFDIVTTSNRDIELNPNGTGKVVIKGNTNQGSLTLNCEANTHGQKIIAASHSDLNSSSGNPSTLTLPSTGDASQELVSTSATQTLTNKTIGVGQLSGQVAVSKGGTGATSLAGANIVTTNANHSFTAAQRGSTDTDTSNTGSVTLDFDANQNFVLTLTGNVTLANPSTESAGQSGFIVLIQDGTGGRTVSLGTDYETAGGAGLTLSTAASTTDIVPYVVAASGRILLGAPQLAFA